LLTFCETIAIETNNKPTNMIVNDTTKPYAPYCSLVYKYNI
jgi:hypothetical protein